MPDSPSPATRASVPTSRPRRRDGVLASIVRANRRLLAWVLPLSLVSEGGELLIPIAVGWVIDRGIMRGDLTFTLLGAVGVVVFRLLTMLAWRITWLASQRACQVERHRLRVGITGAVLDPRSRTAERPAGEVLSIATSDADKASDVLDMLPWVFPSALSVLAMTLWFFVLDVWLGLAMLVGIGVLVLVIRVITPMLSKRYDDQQSEAAEAAATATDLVHGLRVLQGLGVQSRAQALYRRRSRTALDAALMNSRFSGIASGMSTLVTTSMLAAVVVLAALRAYEGALSIGVLIAVVGVARNMMGMLQGLSGVPVWWASMSTSAQRVRVLLADLGHTPDDPELALEVHTVARDDRGGSLAADGRRPGAGGLHARDLRSGSLTGIDLDVPDGTVLAVACADPRDADSLIDALRGRNDAGILLGDRPITPQSAAHLRADLLIEPHTVDLFDGTVREQLATRAPAATLVPTGADGSAADIDSAAGADAWADRALHAAGAEDLLQILPEGYDTRILDRGSNLSGGQRQRLALARAVAADAPVLVLHDPTTAVDAVTEQRIAQALTAARRSPDRATLLLTRAPALLAAADQVVFVAEGCVAARGEHADLMELEDYRKMVQR